MNYYGAVEQFLDKNPTFRNSFDHHYRGFNIMDTVQKRRALGENQVAKTSTTQKFR